MGFLIPYNNKIKKAFDIVVIFLNVIYIGFTIFYLTFRSGEKATYLQVFDAVMFVIYTVYIVTNFVYSYELPNGEIEKSNKKIAIHYLKGWFIIDFISSIPFELFSDKINAHITAILRLIRINKCYQFFANMSEVSFKTAHFVDLIKLAFTDVFGTFLFASIWFNICKLLKKENKHNFISKHIDECGDDKFLALLRCIYYTLTTLSTTGFGDYVPHSNNEKIAGFFIMLFGFIFFSFLFSLLYEEITIPNERDNIQAQKLITDLKKLNGGKEKLFFGGNVTKSVLNNVHYTVKKSRYEKLAKKYNFDILPTSIKETLTNYLWMDVFSRITNYFMLIDSDKRVQKFLFKLSESFYTKYYNAKSVVYHPAFLVSEVNIIRSGYVDIENPNVGLKKRIGPNEGIGHFYAIFNIKPKYPYIAASKVTLTAINRDVFVNALNEDPYIMQIVKRVSIKKFREIFNQLSSRKAIKRHQEVVGVQLKSESFKIKQAFEIIEKQKEEAKMDEPWEKDIKDIKLTLDRICANENYLWHNVDVNSCSMKKIYNSFEIDRQICKKLSEMKNKEMRDKNKLYEEKKNNARYSEAYD